MMDFTKDSIFNLKKIDDFKINKNAAAILLDEEKLLGVYKTVRDQVIFTDKRIITVDEEGMTGSRQEIFNLPYSKIQYFSVTTKGVLELVPDCEMTLYFADKRVAVFEFRGRNDILEIGRSVSRYSL